MEVDGVVGLIGGTVLVDNIAGEIVDADAVGFGSGSG